MKHTFNLIDDDRIHDLYEIIKLLRRHHLASGGDPREFPKFLEDNGVKTTGFLTTVDDDAIALLQLLKD